MKSEKRKSPQTVRTMTTMSRLSTDEEPDPRPTNINQADSHEEVIILVEEVTKLDQEPGEEEIRAMELTAIETESSAIFAKSRDTGKRSAGNDLRKTRRAATLKGVLLAQDLFHGRKPRNQSHQLYRS
jgi:hypothetical protein